MTIQNQSRYLAADGNGKLGQVLQSIGAFLDAGQQQLEIWQKPTTSPEYNAGLGGTDTTYDINIGAPKQTPKEDKKILGMKPAVFYPVIGVVGLAAIIGIIYAVKKK